MSKRERDPFDAFEFFTIGAGIITLILLSLGYFGVPSLAFLDQATKDFLQAVITNLVPTLLIFVLAYALLYRRIEKLRSERETQRLVQATADEVAKRLYAQSIEATLLEEIPGSFREDLAGARDMWVVTVSANTLMNQYYSQIDERLKQDMILHVVIVDPDSAAFEMATSRSYARPDMEQARSTARGNLTYLKNLRDVAPNQVKVRLINNPLTFGAFLFDPTTTTGRLYIRHYAYKTPGGPKPHMMFTAQRSRRWFDHFHREIQALWDDGKEWVN